MRKYIIFLVLFSICISSGAQKYLRYQMKNNEYHGYYTWFIESVFHDNKNGNTTSFINTSGINYEIPINDIDSVIVEDISVNEKNVGQYRIYEFNNEGGDLGKIYVDNRASLFASRNGDFGANDTILFSSRYNGIAWLFFTDSIGRIKKFFDSNRLIYFDYENDSEFTMFDMLSHDSKSYKYNNQTRQAGIVTRATSFFSNLVNNKGFRDFLAGIGLSAANSIATNFAQNIQDVRNNPELHNQLLIVNGLAIAGDLIGMGASVLYEVPTLGWSSASLVASACSFYENCSNFFNLLWPDSVQMREYKYYYKNKYSIQVVTLPAENISYHSATLHGEVLTNSKSKLKGTLNFNLYNFDDEEEMLAGVSDNIGNNHYVVTADAVNLKPGNLYFYNLQLICIVDGLKLIFDADEAVEFSTLSPAIYTGGIHSYSPGKTEVICQFYDVPEGTICGVEYSSIYEKKEVTTSYTHEGEYFFTLTPLKPYTEYTYRAFVVIDGCYIYAKESRKFNTGNVGSICPDSNHPHMIDLGLPSGTKWACCNVGALSPEDYGEYYAWGEITTKTIYTRQNYTHRVFDENRSRYRYTVSGVISGTSNDVANQRWGESWHMPTKKECEELIKYCAGNTIYHEEVHGSSGIITINGIKGILITGLNGNQVFFPMAGIGSVDGISSVGSSLEYWTGYSDYDDFWEMGGPCSLLGWPESGSMQIHIMLGTGYECNTDYRFCGYPIRPTAK